MQATLLCYRTGELWFEEFIDNLCICQYPRYVNTWMEYLFLATLIQVVEINLYVKKRTKE